MNTAATGGKPNAMNHSPNHCNNRKENPMSTLIRTASVTILVALGLALTAGAAEPAAGKTWTLATEDTELTLTLTGNTLSIDTLRNPAQGWNWTPKSSKVPLLAQVVVGNAPRPLIPRVGDRKGPLR